MLSTKMIGSKIVTARKKTNLSQAQLADRLSISPQAVGKWERGESMPDITTFSCLAEILGVDLNYFSEKFGANTLEKDSNKPSEETSSTPSSEKERKKHSWDMSSGNWVDADFSGLKDLQEKFSSSNMQNCKFISSDLSGLQLKGNNIDRCDFSKSDIRASHMDRSHMVNNKFNNCLLQESEFTADLINGCDFSEADMSEVKISTSTFINNTVSATVWYHTSFTETQIDNIDFEGTIDNCSFDNCSFKKVTFKDAILINTFFKGRKLKGIRFIDCKADRMTYEFLKNGKADLNGVTLLNP